MLTVATWNVLHRIHAENWDEPVIGAWPDERARVAAVAARIAARPETVIGLQEVSGDQLAALLLVLPPEVVHTMAYPRVPRARHRPVELADPGEYLVTVAAGAVQGESGSFPGDPGKGFQVLRVGGVLVVNAHVTYGPARPAELARLAALTRDASGPVVLMGDFNAGPADVAEGLGPGFTLAEPPPGALPTRAGSAGTHIDHVVVRGGKPVDVRVEDAGGLSDHNLLRAAIAA